MKKMELGALVFIIIISTIYSFEQPNDDFASIETKKQITVYVEGTKKEALVFTKTPTVAGVFQQLQMQNIYGFDDQLVLEDKQILYLPETMENRISLNQGTIEQFMTIKGIGEKTATKIIDQRNIEPYKTIEDIQKVSGIGEKTYYRMREFLCL